VKDPTEEQLEESVEFLEAVMEMGAPQNEWEQQAVQRIHDVLRAALEQGTIGEQGSTQKPPVDEPAGDQRQEQADVGGGVADEEKTQDITRVGESTSVTEDTSTLEERERFLAERGMDTSLAETGPMEQLIKIHEEQVESAGSTEPAAQGLSNTNFVTLSEDESKKNAQEFANSAQQGQAAEPTGPKRDDTGYFRDKQGRVISRREAQKLWDAEHKKNTRT
jgi:hypothetical protein